MRRTLGFSTLAWAFAGGMAGQVAAAEWVLGIGADDAFDAHNKVVAVVLAEYHSDPFRTYGRTALSWMAAVQADADGDVLGVAGVYFLSRVRDSRWIVEGSLGAGALHQGSNPYKEGDTFQFRTSIGAGYELLSGARISVSIDHLFDKNFQNHNPGTESVMLRYTRPF